MRKVMAVDAGFANVGVAVMAYGAGAPGGEVAWHPVELGCIQTEKCGRKMKIGQQDDNARRIGEATRAICEIIRRHDIKAMVVELPAGGGPRANVVMMLALASGMIVAIAECFGLAVEYYTPSDTRRAAGVPSTTKDRDNVKKIVMAEMGRLYPALERAFPALERRNHVADALSCFEAARHGNIVRGMEAR